MKQPTNAKVHKALRRFRNRVLKEAAEAALNAPIKTARQEQREACYVAILGLIE